MYRNNKENARNTETLRVKCCPISSVEEAEVLINLLNSNIISYRGQISTLSAPQLNVMKSVAIIRTPYFTIDLINPVIVNKSEEKILSFSESCSSYLGQYLNCLRHKSIVVQNGFNKQEKTYTGKEACLLQHAIDHLNGINFIDRKIKTAIVRDNGEVKLKDFCPCASRKKFEHCCKEGKNG